MRSSPPAALSVPPISSSRASSAPSSLTGVAPSSGLKRYAQVRAGLVNRDGQAEPARRKREGLVDGSVHLRLKRRTESRSVQRWIHMDPIDSGTLREALESQREAELVQQRWAQRHGKGSAVLERLRHVPSRGGDPGRSILGAVEPEAV